MKEKEERAYKAYVTDSLYCIAHNTAKMYGGKEQTVRWDEIMHPKKEDTRTADEIALDVIKRLGLEVE